MNNDCLTFWASKIAHDGWLKLPGFHPGNDTWQLLIICWQMEAILEQAVEGARPLMPCSEILCYILLYYDEHVYADPLFENNRIEMMKTVSALDEITLIPD